MPDPIVLPYFMPSGHARLVAVLDTLGNPALGPLHRLLAWAELNGLPCRHVQGEGYWVVEYTHGLRASHTLWLLHVVGDRAGELRLEDRVVVPIDELPRYSIGAHVPALSDGDREDMEFRDRHEGHVHD